MQTVTSDVRPSLAAQAGVRPPLDSAEARRPRVALIVETSLAPGREILMGIARAVRGDGASHPRWSTCLEPRNLEASTPGWLEAWRGDGIIARVQSPEIARAVQAAGVPVVDVLGIMQLPGVPVVHVDDAHISQLAAEHMIERGIRHFAFVGLADENWSKQRCDAFAAAVKRRGKSWSARTTSRDVHLVTRREGHADDLVSWIAALPKPVGIMLCSDQLGPAVLEACQVAGVRVPEEVAVIGVDDDEPLCEVAGPGLSSVWPDHERVGFEAARLLDRLMSGERPPTAPILVPPRGVVTRRSTDSLAFADREVAAAIEFIREQAFCADGITIDDVAAHVSVSRSVLQRRFKAATHRTLHDQILGVRLARARELLAETDLPITDVAEKSGFRHQEYMGVVFRRKLNTTPAQYRRSHQR